MNKEFNLIEVAKWLRKNGYTFTITKKNKDKMEIYSSENVGI